MKKKYTVEGMACSACSSAVERAVKRVNGVKTADVNLVSKILLVEYDAEITSDSEVISAVSRAGFTATANESADKKESAEERFCATRKGERCGNDKALLSSQGIRLSLSIAITVLLMYFSMGVTVGLPQPSIFVGVENARWLMLFLCILTIPVLALNSGFFIKGFNGIVRGVLGMDTLVSLGSLSAFIYGVYSLCMVFVATAKGQWDAVTTYVGNVYFDSAAMILTLVSVGKLLEERSKIKTDSAINKLRKLTPNKAAVLVDGEIKELPIGEICIGDTVVVKAGEGIPVDGVVIRGGGAVNESAITGESMPVFKGEGDRVMSSGINTDGYLEIKVEKTDGDTVLAQIIDLMQTAGATKAPIARLADKVSGVFVPIVSAIAVVTFTVWLILGRGVDFALSNAISVLVISCPCALGLATPLAITVASGKCASNGILVKSAQALERIKDIDIFVFDKTGTLTKGEPTVTDCIPMGSMTDEASLLLIANALERGSKHPLAVAVCRYAEQNGYAGEANVENYVSVAGKGVRGVLKGRAYYSGNAAFMTENGIDTQSASDLAVNFNACGKTVIYLADMDGIIGVIAVSDEIKPESFDAVLKLQKAGKTVAMLSGDGKAVSYAMAEKLGITKEYVYAERLPSEKAETVNGLKEGGRRIAFIGDGINDSPALAAADVGIAVGGGSDIAIDAAEIVLMKGDPEDVYLAMRYSADTVANIKISLFWAFFYNALCIPLSAGVFSGLGILLNPMIAAACMSLSSIFVALNALTLNKVRGYEKEKK